ncbi:MAG: hypothetical protein NZ699_10685 [Roseiflexus sp.]|nr:hypothetical protein [Roseiflexus sp.]MCS7289584.1 hypothetical protein [Roseiflexus sp.]MDW8148627.1 hypothetical protein [Roseiflexaceae bacterium]MDW8231725.1 hypothetical protein [Roseiflexaceae bacterium]
MQCTVARWRRAVPGGATPLPRTSKTLVTVTLGTDAELASKIAAGLHSGAYELVGGVVRRAESKQVVAWLRQVGGCNACCAVRPSDRTARVTHTDRIDIIAHPWRDSDRICTRDEAPGYNCE